MKATSEILIIGAVLAVYLTLGMLYESVWHPLTILSTIPSAGIGAVIALDLFGLPFSSMAVIAMLLLTDISLKNAILLVDFAIHAEREHSLTSRDAILADCLLRLRPIVMTTFAAALGALPLVLMGGLRDGTAPAIGHRADQWSAGQSGPDHVHHASALSACRAMRLFIQERRNTMRFSGHVIRAGD